MTETFLLAGTLFLIVGIAAAAKPKKFIWLYGFPWNLILKRKFPGPFGTSRENLPTLYRFLGIALIIVGLTFLLYSA